MKRMYLFFAVTVMALFAVDPVSAQYQIPHGFVTYSKGNGYDRVLCRVEIAPGMTFEEIHATEQQICEKGELGGDVEGQISFDGKWLAFARCAGKTEDGSGGNDYGDFGQWDIYVVRIDGPLPAKPIRIDRGYYPSWGDDSYGDSKTLYYAQAKTGKVFKVMLSSDGSVSEKEFVGQVPSEGLENFVFMAPDGTFAAYRQNSNVYTHYFSGPLAGKDILLTHGCHPHVTADSKWVYHAKKQAVRSDGSARGDAGAGGNYHYGSSQDMHFFITRTLGDSPNLNIGNTVHLCALWADYTHFETEQIVRITDEGSFPDVHVYEDRASEKAIRYNTKYLMTGRSKEAVERTKKIVSVTAAQTDRYPVGADGAIFSWGNSLSNNQIVSASGEFIRADAVVPHGYAYIGQGNSMEIRKGYFTPMDEEVNRLFTDIARKENQFAFELEFRADDPEASGPARMISLSDGTSDRNWTLGQQGDKLVLRLRTTETGSNGTPPETELGIIEMGKVYHVAVSYQPGILMWSINGRINQTMKVQGDLSNWSDNNRLIFGDEWGGGRAWRGNIRNVVIYGWALSVKQMKQRAKSVLKHSDELAFVAPIAVKARLVRSSTVPASSEVLEQGYRRCIVSREYEVVEGSGSVSPGRIVVKEWTLMDGSPVNDKKEGETYELSLLPEAVRPELNSEYTSDDLLLFDLPIYFNVATDD